MARQFSPLDGHPVRRAALSNVTTRATTTLPDAGTTRGARVEPVGLRRRRDVAQSVPPCAGGRRAGAESFIIAAADTVMRRPSRELMEEVFPGVPVAAACPSTAPCSASTRRAGCSGTRRSSAGASCSRGEDRHDRPGGHRGPRDRHHHGGAAPWRPATTGCLWRRCSWDITPRLVCITCSPTSTSLSSMSTPGTCGSAELCGAARVELSMPGLHCAGTLDDQHPVTLECAGNGRSLLYSPRPFSQPWVREGVGEQRNGSGVPLAYLLGPGGGL